MVEILTLRFGCKLLDLSVIDLQYGGAVTSGPELFGVDNGGPDSSCGHKYKNLISLHIVSVHTEKLLLKFQLLNLNLNGITSLQIGINTGHVSFSEYDKLRP